MQIALDHARAAAVVGEVPVGAVVVSPEGEIIGIGHNDRENSHNPIGHAEIIALSQAATNLGTWRLDDCTLVVTLEPCTMCAGAIVQSRVSRLVFGAFDEKAGAVGSLWDVVRDRRLPHRPEVVSGVLAQECAQILSDFFATTRNSKS
ncbi:MAG: tRNA adenosine(34) deaminase TadA [Actinomycetales bacterium]|nr:tRNA adenosine(34) deaminase TadA [Actinomycetales bacterium]